MMSDGNQDIDYSRKDRSCVMVISIYYQSCFKDYTAFGVIIQNTNGGCGIGYNSDGHSKFSCFALHSQLLRQIQTDRPSY